MRQLCFNKPLLFSLITAFLFLQWSATHIHLASEHKHDGGQHQHAVTAHQHQLASHHTDVIDNAGDTLSHVDTSKVVELEHVCTQVHSKPGKLFAVIASSSWDSFKQQLSSNTSATYYRQNIFQTYHQYTSIRLRAPPIVS